MTNQRKSEYDIAPIFVNRWSPRSFEPVNIEETEILRMFEAARWAPSASNVQPWRFFYALRQDEVFKDYISCLVEFNQMWAHNASALVFVTSLKNNSEGKPNQTHSFDTGAAWMSFALQALEQGFITHGMSGINKDQITKLLNLPDDYEIHAAIAVGKQGPVENLHERMQKSEHPSDRIHVKEFALRGVLEG